MSDVGVTYFLSKEDYFSEFSKYVVKEVAHETKVLKRPFLES